MSADLSYMITKSKCSMDCGAPLLIVLIAILCVWFALLALARNNDRKDVEGLEIQNSTSNPPVPKVEATKL